jgi:hypothetical protein
VHFAAKQEGGIGAPPFLQRVDIYALGLFFSVLLGVSLYCFLGVPASMNDVPPCGMGVVCCFLVMPTIVMFGRLFMVASGVCKVLCGLLVMFSGFFRHVLSSSNEPQLTTASIIAVAVRNGTHWMAVPHLV